jgi:hypothetical protein
MLRLFIYTKDVQQIVGRCERTASNLLAKIKQKHHKSRSQPVSVAEFCEYMQLDMELVLMQLK